MYQLWIVLIAIFFLTLFPQRAFASNSIVEGKNLIADVMIPLNLANDSSSDTANLGTKGSNASQVISSIISAFKMLDKLSGGIVFSTPSIFDNKFSLSDGSTITGFGNFRIAFTAIGALIGAFVLLWKSGKSALTLQLSYLKSVGGRILFFALASIGIPLLLSYSIQATNAFNDTILPQHESLTTFIQDYYNDVGQQVNSGTPSDNFWISNTGFLDLFNNFTHGVFELLLFAVSILALVFGILFIIFQFALRFLTLVFLSIIYPLVLPFLLTEETEGIFYSFLKVWFTALIHQPAFILGYALILYIVRSLLLSDHASIGLFFIYIAALFFLGTVNVLASRIFADAFVALGTNLEAGFAARSVRVSIDKGIKFGRDNWSKLRSSKADTSEDNQQKRGRGSENQTTPREGYRKRTYGGYQNKRLFRGGKKTYVI